MILGVVALLAAVSMGVASQPRGVPEFRLDGEIMLLIPGYSSTLEEGERLYAEIDLYGEGDLGGVIIGKGHYMAMGTAPVGVSGSMGLFFYEIFGEGEIHVSVGPGSGFTPPRVGVIIGGTGIYRGVTGEYSHVTDAPDLYITFKFNSRRNFRGEKN